MKNILSSDDDVDNEGRFTWKPVHKTFEVMGLRPDLLRGIYSNGYEKPTAIQQRGIVPFLKRLHVIQQAPSVTGKIVTFCSGILHHLDFQFHECQALVLAPTRESAMRIERVMRALGHYLQVKVDGYVREDMDIDIRVSDQAAGAHVVVGTPERVFEMLRRKALSANYINCLVLDEADEMLSRGFQSQIHHIFMLLPKMLMKPLQVCLYSATMPPEVMKITRKLMRRPTEILVKQGLSLEGVKRFHVDVDREESKLDNLCDLYAALDTTQSVDFVNSRHKVDWLRNKLQARNFTGRSATHGNMHSSTRARGMSSGSGSKSSEIVNFVKMAAFQMHL